MDLSIMQSVIPDFTIENFNLFSGFYVKDMSAMGYETGVKYEVWDYENDEIEFYITDRDQSYVICFNHHDVLYGCGAAKEWVEKLANFKS